jgi:hypothetical protein
MIVSDFLFVMRLFLVFAIAGHRSTFLVGAFMSLAMASSRLRSSSRQRLCRLSHFSAYWIEPSS